MATTHVLYKYGKCMHFPCNSKQTNTQTAVMGELTLEKKVSRILVLGMRILKRKSGGPHAEAILQYL